MMETETHDNINRLEQEFQRRVCLACGACYEGLAWAHHIMPCPSPALPLQIVVVNQNLHAILQKSHHMQRIREMFGNKRRALRPLAGLAEEQVRSYCFCLCYLWEENEEERG